MKKILTFFIITIICIGCTSKPTEYIKDGTKEINDSLTKVFE